MAPIATVTIGGTPVTCEVNSVSIDRRSGSETGTATVRLLGIERPMPNQPVVISKPDGVLFTGRVFDVETDLMAKVTTVIAVDARATASNTMRYGVGTSDVTWRNRITELTTSLPSGTFVNPPGAGEVEHMNAMAYLSRFGTLPAGVTPQWPGPGAVKTGDRINLNTNTTGSATQSANAAGWQLQYTGLPSGAYWLTAWIVNTASTTRTYRITSPDTISDNLAVAIPAGQVRTLYAKVTAASPRFRIAMSTSLSVGSAGGFERATAAIRLTQEVVIADDIRLVPTVYESSVSNHLEMACRSAGVSWRCRRDGIIDFPQQFASDPVVASFNDEHIPSVAPSPIGDPVRTNWAWRDPSYEGSIHMPSVANATVTTIAGSGASGRGSRALRVEAGNAVDLHQLAELTTHDTLIYSNTFDSYPHNTANPDWWAGAANAGNWTTAASGTNVLGVGPGAAWRDIAGITVGTWYLVSAALRSGDVSSRYVRIGVGGSYARARVNGSASGWTVYSAMVCAINTNGIAIEPESGAVHADNVFVSRLNTQPVAANVWRPGQGTSAHGSLTATPGVFRYTLDGSAERTLTGLTIGRTYRLTVSATTYGGAPQTVSVDGLGSTAGLTHTFTATATTHVGRITIGGTGASSGAWLNFTLNSSSLMPIQAFTVPYNLSGRPAGASAVSVDVRAPSGFTVNLNGIFTTGDGSWKRLQAPLFTDSATLTITPPGSPAEAPWVEVDGWLCVVMPTQAQANAAAALPYFDGASEPADGKMYSWDSSPHNSQSYEYDAPYTTWSDKHLCLMDARASFDTKNVINELNVSNHARIADGAGWVADDTTTLFRDSLSVYDYGPRSGYVDVSVRAGDLLSVATRILSDQSNPRQDVRSVVFNGQQYPTYAATLELLDPVAIGVAGVLGRRRITGLRHDLRVDSHIVTVELGRELR